MTTRIKFFRDGRQASESRQFLSNHEIKTFLRDREGAHPHDPPAGFELFVLRDDDVEEARKLIDYEYGESWGENAK